MKPTRLQSPRLVLDGLTPDDALAVFEYCQDDELQRWIPVPQPYGMNDANYFVGPHARTAEGSQAITIWAIRGEVGLLGLIELRFEPLRSATVGYWLGAPHRGHGIMTEALNTIIDFAFDSAGLGLTRLHWDSAVGNVGSAIVARRTGFVFEGVSRASIVHRDERLDSWEATLLATDDRGQSDRNGWPV